MPEFRRQGPCAYVRGVAPSRATAQQGTGTRHPWQSHLSRPRGRTQCVPRASRGSSQRHTSVPSPNPGFAEQSALGLCGSACRRFLSCVFLFVSAGCTSPDGL